MSQRFNRFGVVVLMGALLVSLITNAAVFSLGQSYYLQLNRTRLDPLDLDAYPIASELVPPAAPGEVIVVFDGDSRASNWPAPSAPPTYRFINRGVGAQTTAQVLGRFDAHIASLQPDLLILQVGINDLKTVPLFPNQRDMILARCEENILAIVNKARQLGATVILTTIFPVGKVPIERQLFWSDEVAESVNTVNAYLQTLASDDVIIFESADVLADANGRLNDRYSQDTLHLNLLGYEALNQELIQTLSTLASSKQPK